MRQGRSPADLVYVTMIQNDPIGLPSRWKTEDLKSLKPIIDVNREFERVAAPFSALWIREASSKGSSVGLAVQQLQRGVPVSDDVWTSISALVIAVEPALAQTSSAVLLKNYCYDECVAPVEVPNFFAIQTFSKGAGLAGHYYARQQKWDQALEAPVLALKKVQHNEESMVISRLIAMAVLGTQVQHLSVLTDSCPSPASLETTLRDLNLLRNRILPPLSQPNCEAYDHIVPLHRMRRSGYFDDLPPDRPAIYYFRKLGRSLYNYPEWALNNLSLSAESKAAVESMARERGRLTTLLLSYGSTLVPEVYLQMRFDFHDVQRRYSVASARYDLLRIKLTRRIAELKGQPIPEAGEAQMLATLPLEVRDHFTSGSYKIDPKSKTMYNIGPDGVDNGLTIIYDSTNGTVSLGDVWLGK
jgi:hypothetical protein